METEQKIELLNNLGTAKLISDIHEQENKLEQLLLADSIYRSQNVGYLSGYGEDCREVKALLADLALEPPVTTDGKKLTAAQLEAWLRQQRAGNALAKAIKTQNEVTFKVENARIYIDVAKKRLESLKGLLALRTAQIEFLK